MEKTTQPAPVSQQLPFDVRMALARAARTPVTGPADLARVKAIDEVMTRARAQFPKLFKG